MRIGVGNIPDPFLVDTPRGNTSLVERINLTMATTTLTEGAFEQTVTGDGIVRVRLFWRVGAERDFPVLCP